MSEFIKDNRASYERWTSSKKIFLPGGRAPEPGEVFVQAELGRTLQYLADVEQANRRKGRRAA
jgi:gamma-glutamyltranspeptidase/glutathione hydrolase